ncbi:membrane protein [Bacteroidia bacterium]|nr:membrane protein [Bacteroidia bacterium]
MLILASCGKQKGDYDASGVFEAIEVMVSAQASGEILQWDVTEGQALQIGQQVGQIDTVQLQLKKEQLLANIKASGSRTYDVALQIAAIKQQIVQQQTDLARVQALLQVGGAPQKQVDDIQSSITVLQRQLAAQESTLRNNNSGIVSESEALQIQIAQIEDQIEKSRMVAPITGTVLSKYAELGELAAPGKALFKMADLDHLFLRAYITADQLTQLKLNQEVSVFADFGKQEMKKYTGHITWIADKAEFTPRTVLTKNERANLVYAVKIAVKNDGYLKIGMYGEIKIR